MMHRASCAAFMVFALLTASSCSDDAPSPQSDVAPDNGICLQTDLIDHTDILDDKTVIFHMKGGVSWKNSLQYACTSLKNEGGFSFVTSTPEICSNSEAIRVLRSGILCELGEFTPYAPPPASAAPAAEPSK